MKKASSTIIWFLEQRDAMRYIPRRMSILYNEIVLRRNTQRRISEEVK